MNTKSRERFEWMNFSDGPVESSEHGGLVIDIYPKTKASATLF